MFLDKKLKNFQSEDFKKASKFAKDAGYLTPIERRALYNFGKTLQGGRPLSTKQIKWAEKLVEELKDLAISKKEEPTFDTEDTQMKKHITARQAWHDNKWNGKVCKKPSDNDYCVGDYSLLSRRIRHRRNKELEDKCAECVPDMEVNNGYIPPCYWSINTFGDETFEVRHDHPLSTVEANKLYETLGSSSILTWPFKLSFTREKKQKQLEGDYPKNLEKRIERYFNRVIPDESIVFTYCNYDNPVSADDQLYLVTGCGIVRNVIDAEHYTIDNYEEIKKQDRLKNFPTINWSSQVQLHKDSLVRIPYHEYLEDAEKNGDYSHLDRIKVTVDEPQLIPYFKFVSMDMSDDEAIYLLTKIRRSLDIVREDGFFKEYSVEDAIDRVENLLKHCWGKRGYFPGFVTLSAVISGRKDSFNEYSKFKNELIDQLPVNEQYEAFHKILCEPSVLDEYNLGDSEDLIEELIESFETLRLSVDDFLKLAMIDLLPAHFHRIIKGDKEKDISAKKVLDNPYLLYEQYREEEWKDNSVSGETELGPIDLFKIDIAYFPDRKYSKKQRTLQNLKESDNRRVRAIIIQHLEGLEKQGHCFDRDDQIMEKLTDYPLFYKSDYGLPSDLLQNLESDLKEFLEEKLVIKEDKNHFYFYLNSVHQMEEEVANTFHKLLEMDDIVHQYEVDLSSSMKKLSEKLGINFDKKLYNEERNHLFKNIFSKRLYVLTGVPGSGKSFELLRTIENLREQGETYQILTPTGKAALRLNLNEEKVRGIEAKTIDKFLSENEVSSPNSIELKNLILDEMSMVDLTKFYELIRLINFNSPKFNRLIMVGDPNQLPPIGYGKVFVDLIEYIHRKKEYHGNINTLETNCRIEQDERIKNVTEIFSGGAKYGEHIIRSISNGDTRGIDDFHINYWENREELRKKVHNRFLELCRSEEREASDESLEISLNQLLGLRENGTVDNSDHKFQEKLKIDRFQIITPYRAGYYSTLGLNLFIQNEFKTKNKIYHNSKFKTGDKAILTQNKYERGKLTLSNGSMGVYKGGNNAKFYFLENEFPQQRSKFSSEEEELELAYAITVHKSQGSGFEHTFIVIPQKKTLLSKELVYTALTRSKKSLSLFLYGDENKFQDNYKFLQEIIDRSDIATRRTTLMDKTFWGYSLTPKEGVKVKSRAEYIIYKKLEELSDNHSKFGFSYESPLELEGRDFEIKPDFTIKMPDGSIIYWEHLGMLNSNKYVREWHERKKILQEENIFGRVLTTDESHGLDDSKIESLINEIARGEITGISNRLSDHHYYLA